MPNLRSQILMADMIEYAYQIDMFYSFLNGRLVNGGGWESGPRSMIELPISLCRFYKSLVL